MKNIKCCGEFQSLAQMIPRSRPFFLALLFLFSSVLVGTANAKPEDKDRWDSKYSKEQYIYGKEPVVFLRNNVQLLPKGKALDIAMGEGRNGVFLATQGFDVFGLDISETGLQKAHKLAAAKGAKIQTRVADLENITLEKSTYDVVLCMYYLQHDLFPQIKEALKSGGMAVVETYNTDYLKYNPRFFNKYALQTNELLDIFKDFKIIRYQSYDDGKEAYSSIIAQKP